MTVCPDSSCFHIGVSVIDFKDDNYYRPTSLDVCISGYVLFWGYPVARFAFLSIDRGRGRFYGWTYACGTFLNCKNERRLLMSE